MFFYRYFLLIFLIIYSKCDTFDDFYGYVNSNIANAASWTAPTNNEELYSTNNSDIKSFGNWDFIIIGGGSAGALVASRLSEVKKWNVLVLEAGNNQTEFSDIPALNNFLYRSEMNWGYFTSQQNTVCQGMINNTCVYPRGKVLGGSGGISGVINTRGIPNDYDQWVLLGNPGWSYLETLPYFKKFEKVDFENANSFYYGRNGNIHVNFTTPPSIVADTFLNANLQNGLNQIDYNADGIQGISRIQFHIKGIKRDNSAHGYLDPVMDRPNLKIVLKAFVTKILISNNTAYGVEFIKDGQTYQANANKEVILSAGTINSPQILLLSGIGPAVELAAKGIELKNNLPAVGKHLKDQPMFVNLFFRTNLTAPNLSLKENLQRYVAGLTPFTNGARLEQLGFINTKKDSPFLRNAEFITFPPPFSVPANPKNAFNFNTDYVNAYSTYNTLTDISVLVVVLKPKSEGSVTLKSNSPIDFPNIDVNFFSDPLDEDIECMYQAIKYLLSLTDTPAFKKVNATLVSIQPACEHLRNVDDKEYWYCSIRHASSTIYHPTGTTRMGISPLTSVVNTYLEVHNMKKLRVVDAGIMPDAISGHTNTPTYMIAEKISSAIKQRYGILF